MNRFMNWTPELAARVAEVVSKESTLEAAVTAASQAIGYPLSRPALDAVFRKYGYPTAHQLLWKGIPPVGDRPTEKLRVAPAHAPPDDAWTTAAKTADTIPPPPLSQPPVEIVDDSPEVAEAAPHERFAQLVEFVKKQTKRGGVALEQLCDELDMSPKAARAYLDEAREVGITIDVAHEKLLFRAPEPTPSAPAMAVTPSTMPGRDHRIGVFSDMHFGSLYCLRDQFRAFVLRCYHEFGIRDFFCSGDVIEGCYRHAQFERSSESLDAQQGEFLDAYPHLEGMRMFFIDGNHDYTFTEKTGVQSGQNLVRLARERGRDDIFFLGSRGAIVQYGDTRIELWHPKRGKAYAISYQLQNKIRDTSPARLPNILLCGHVHEYVKFLRSGVFAFYAGTFQHGDAPYGRSIGGDVAMGGLVIDWRVDGDGVIRELGDSFKATHHEPKVFDVAV